MNQLNREKRAAVIRCLVEGCSIRSTVRITGVAKNTIQKLSRDLGPVCLNFQDSVLHSLPCTRIQCDEIWNFCYAKDKNLPAKMRGMPGVGSMWTWTALCDTTKLLVSWQLGARDAANAHRFMSDVQGRLTNRVQLTTDGNTTYLEAVETNFGCAIDYAQLIKQYGKSEEKPDTGYSPAKCLGTKRKKVAGNPDPDHISTSYAERQNSTSECRTAGILGSRTPSARRPKCWLTACRSCSPTTTSFAFTRRSKPRQPLKPGSSRAPGRLKTWWT